MAKNNTKGNKRPITTEAVREGKAVRQVEEPSEGEITFTFSRFDRDFPCHQKCDQKIADHLKRLSHYSGKRFVDVNRVEQHCHFTPVNSLEPEAKKRWSELNLVYDELFQFAFDGKRRLWCIKDNNFFHVLWWDPEHVVYKTVTKDNKQKHARKKRKNNR